MYAQFTSCVQGVNGQLIFYSFCCQKIVSNTLKSVYDDFVDIIYYKVKVSGGPEDQFIASFFLK